MTVTMTDRPASQVITTDEEPRCRDCGDADVCCLDRQRRQPIQGWAVSVDVNGQTILTIGHNHLSGIENIDEYADVVRNCVRHLLSFIGDGVDGESPSAAKEG